MATEYTTAPRSDADPAPGGIELIGRGGPDGLDPYRRAIGDVAARRRRHDASHERVIDDEQVIGDGGSAALGMPELVEALFDAAPISMVVTTAEHPMVIVRANEAYLTMSGRSDEALTRAVLDDDLHPDDAIVAAAARSDLIEGRIARHRMDVRMTSANHDGWRWCSMTRSVVRDQQGCATLVVAQIEDIHERRLTAAENDRLAHTDSLTELANRRQFDRSLRGAAEGDPARSFGVIYLDLDRFKEVNDVLGHEAGDLVLVEVAAALSDAVRPDDLVARVGGDEFAVLLRNVTRDELDAVAARIRSTVAVVRMFPDGRAHRVTASIGSIRSADLPDLAPGDADRIDPDAVIDAVIDDVLRRADTAMYSSKRARRSDLER